MTLRLEQALEDAKIKDVSEQTIAQELQKSKNEMKELKESFENVSDELKRVKTEVGKMTTAFTLIHITSF